MRPRRSSPLCLFLVFVLVAAIGRAADVEFVRVWPGWRDAEDFESISEYFSGKEAGSKGTVIRSRPESRAGFYYLVRVANALGAQPGARFVLQLIAPDSPNVKTYTFPADLPARSTVFQLGLTGPDWPDQKLHPVAWKLDLLTADEKLLATSQSFLWSKPAR